MALSTSFRSFLAGTGPYCAAARSSRAAPLPWAGSVGGGQTMTDPEQFPKAMYDPAPAGSGERTAVLAGGCFWCVEAVYRQLDGVSDVVNGYAGGEARTADYRS